MHSTKCVLCGRGLHTPADEALAKLRDLGFPAGQFCCVCFSMYSKIYTILSQPDKTVAVRLNCKTKGDGSHKNTWYTTAHNVVIRHIPEDLKRYDFVIGKLVFANNHIIILRFLRKLTEKAEYIGDEIWGLKNEENSVAVTT